jgi:hypothetical protein
MIKLGNQRKTLILRLQEASYMGPYEHSLRVYKNTEVSLSGSLYGGLKGIAYWKTQTLSLRGGAYISAGCKMWV